MAAGVTGDPGGEKLTDGIERNVKYDMDVIDEYDMCVIAIAPRAKGVRFSPPITMAL